MTSSNDDSSGYVSSISSLIQGSYFVAGFTLTVITLLVTQLRDPTSIFSQVILFLLDILLNLSIFLAAWYSTHLSIVIPYAPPNTKGLYAASILTFVIALLTTFITTPLFLLFGMVYLGLASFAAWIALNSAAYLFIVKPAQEFDNEMKKRQQKPQPTA